MITSVVSQDKLKKRSSSVKKKSSNKKLRKRAGSHSNLSHGQNSLNYSAKDLRDAIPEQEE